ncbi:MAG: aspartate-semialdehyde dehydrogenase [Alphaproteobacteria bacterium]|nr:aspartate-semialdehyde dehydrogenase [Alphaproteobacteria bacterium]
MHNPYTKNVLNPINIAIVGATGAVGTTLISLFEERNFYYDNLYLVASAKSKGKHLKVKNVDYPIHDLAEFDFGQVNLAFFSAGTGISQEWVKKATDKGVIVIDNTNAFRMDHQTPLVVPQVNGHLLYQKPKSGVIANPNCSTIPLVRLLKPIDQYYNLKKIIVSTYQAASGRGLSGINDLIENTDKSLHNNETLPSSKKFSTTLAFNLIPDIDTRLETGFTLEEQKMRQESRKIMDKPELLVSATCVRVPVVNCHSEAVYFECDHHLDQKNILTMLAKQPEVTVYEGQGLEGYPTPRTINNFDHVHVGRVRVDPDNPKAGWLWLVADNLRIGAALNAIQIAEIFLGKEQYNVNACA